MCLFCPTWKNVVPRTVDHGDLKWVCWRPLPAHFDDILSLPPEVCHYSPSEECSVACKLTGGQLHLQKSCLQLFWSISLLVSLKWRDSLQPPEQTVPGMVGLEYWALLHKLIHKLLRNSCFQLIIWIYLKHMGSTSRKHSSFGPQLLLTKVGRSYFPLLSDSEKLRNHTDLLLTHRTSVITKEQRLAVPHRARNPQESAWCTTSRHRKCTVVK